MKVATLGVLAGLSVSGSRAAPYLNLRQHLEVTKAPPFDLSDMVLAFPSDRADEPFSVFILPSRISLQVG
jgi:hypothetical protein